MNIGIKQIDNIKVDGVFLNDYPDFCDAYIESCTIDGKPATDEQMDYIQEEYPELVRDCAENEWRCRMAAARDHFDD